ncbi:MAG: IS21 family transposase [Halobacteriota archaeon]
MYKTYEDMIQVLALKSEGLSNTAIAGRVGIHRETVAKYLRLADQSRDSGSSLKDLFQKGRHRARIIEPYMDYIKSRLKDYPDLTAKRLFKEIQKQGYKGSVRTVRRYTSPLKSNLPSRVYKPYETAMGEQAQVDWGEEKWEINGEIRKVYAFVFILSHSRMRYVEYVTSLDSIVFLHCLQRAFEYVDGVPKTVLFDNAKTVVSERVGGSVRFQGDLLQYAIRMGFQPQACWVEDPESKGKVESTVKYVSKDFFYGRTFESLEEMNRLALNWCEEVNREVHTTTQRVPVEVWEDEKQELTSLPKVRPELFRVVQAKVNKACLFSFSNNQYSVPKEYARKTVRLEVSEHEFRVMSGDKEIGRWSRTHEKGQRFLVEEHYEGRFKGNRQSALEAQFKSLCEPASEYLQGLVEARGHSLRQQMEQIVQLAEEYSEEELSFAMARSIHHKSFGYGTLKNILVKRRQSPESLPGERSAPSDSADLPYVGVEQRDLSYYAQQAEGGEVTWTTSSTA